jgi:hypothetical protein
VRAYTDSSFILRLVTADAASESAIGEYRRLSLPPLFFLLLGLFAGGRLWAGVEVMDIQDDNITAQVLPQYQEITRWPTRVEKEASLATASEIQYSLTNFCTWARRLLSPQWLPPTTPGTLFGLKKWDKKSGDTLFAEYTVNGEKFQIRDTPPQFLLTVTAGGLDERPSDWGAYYRDLCCKYLDAPEGVDLLTNYAKLYVLKYHRPDLNRLQAILSTSNNPAELLERRYWVFNGPEIWTEGKTATFVMWKATAGGWPVAGDFEAGVRQRFPPLRFVLESAPAETLIRYLSDGNSALERSVAAGYLRQRADATNAAPALVAAYDHAQEGEAKMAILYVLSDIACKSGGPSQRLAEELVRKELPSAGDRRFLDVLLSVSNKLAKAGAKDANGR